MADILHRSRRSGSLRHSCGGLKNCGKTYWVDTKETV